MGSAGSEQHANACRTLTPFSSDPLAPVCGGEGEGEGVCGERASVEGRSEPSPPALPRKREREPDYAKRRASSAA